MKDAPIIGMRRADVEGHAIRHMQAALHGVMHEVAQRVELADNQCSGQSSGFLIIPAGGAQHILPGIVVNSGQDIDQRAKTRETHVNQRPGVCFPIDVADGLMLLHMAQIILHGEMRLHRYRGLFPGKGVVPVLRGCVNIHLPVDITPHCQVLPVNIIFIRVKSRFRVLCNSLKSEKARQKPGVQPSQRRNSG